MTDKQTDKQVVAQAETKSTSVILRMSERFGVATNNLMSALMGTALSQVQTKISQPQLIQFMIVADMYGLNPFTKEIYAFADKQGGIVPVVSVDGWSRIINENRQFDGVEFEYASDIAQQDTDAKPCPAWCEAVIYRKDRAKPIRVREYLDEVYRPAFVKEGRSITGPWQTHTKRMLRHKSLIQCARVAFGFANIYDEDEAQRIIEQRGKLVDVTPTEAYPTKTEAVAAAIEKKGKLAPEPGPVTIDQSEMEDDFAATVARELFEVGKKDDALEHAKLIKNEAKRAAVLADLGG